MAHILLEHDTPFDFNTICSIAISMPSLAQTFKPAPNLAQSNLHLAICLTAILEREPYLLVVSPDLFIGPKSEGRFHVQYPYYIWEEKIRYEHQNLRDRGYFIKSRNPAGFWERSNRRRCLLVPQYLLL